MRKLEWPYYHTTQSFKARTKSQWGVYLMMTLLPVFPLYLFIVEESGKKSLWSIACVLLLVSLIVYSVVVMIQELVSEDSVALLCLKNERILHLLQRGDALAARRKELQRVSRSLDVVSDFLTFDYECVLAVETALQQRWDTLKRHEASLSSEQITCLRVPYMKAKQPRPWQDGVEIPDNNTVIA
jgi:hypothetical protein